MFPISKEKLRHIINNMSDKKIFVIGDIMLDEYLWGNVDRISPEAPVPVVDVKKETMQLGGAGNVTKNIISLGGKVLMGTVIGKDHPGENVYSMLHEFKVDCDNVVIDPSRKTSIKTRVVAHSQQVVRIDKEDKDYICENSLKKLTCFSDKEFDAIIISDYGKGVISKQLITLLVDYANKKHIPIYVDPKERNFEHYHNVDLITPNTKELSFGSGLKINPKSDKDIENAAEILFRKLSCKNILATRGEDGMSLFYNGRISHIPSYAQKVFDVTGAGDTVMSVFTLAKVAGANLFEAALISNIAAGIVVGQVGAVSVNRDELLDECLNYTI